jgi:hypothetical protein
MLAQEHGSQLSEQRLELTPILQALPEQRHHLRRHVHATAAALFGKGPDESRMFISTGAGGAVLPDAGFSHFGQRPFEDGPKREQFVLKMLLNIRREIAISGHDICISTTIHTPRQKNAVKTEALQVDLQSEVTKRGLTLTVVPRKIWYF